MLLLIIGFPEARHTTKTQAARAANPEQRFLTGEQEKSVRNEWKGGTRLAIPLGTRDCEG